MPKPAKLYASPTYDGPPITLSQVAALAGCSYVNALERVRDGKRVAGHVWSLTGESRWASGAPGPNENDNQPSVHNGAMTADRPRPRARKLMVSDDFPGRTFTQDEVRRMGRLKANVPLQPYVRKGWQIGGHVWRFEGTPVTRGPGQDNVAPPPVSCTWRKPGKPAAPAEPAPAARGAWRFASDPEAYEVFPMREARPVLDSGARGGVAE